MMQSIALVARISLAVFLLPSGVAKLFHVHSFQRGLADYAILPRPLLRPASWAVIAAEIALGMALLLGVAAPPAAGLAALLMTLFIVAMAVNLRRGRTIECNCYGIASTRTVGPAAILRDVALMAMAVTACITGALATPLTAWGTPWAGWRVGALPDAAFPLVAASTSCLSLVYLLEWGLAVRGQARRVTAMLEEAGS